MTLTNAFPYSTLYFITGITKSKPGVMTLTSTSETGSYPITNGTIVTISNVTGMYEVNRNRYVCGNVDTNANTFAMYDNKGKPVDTSSFNTYVGGGEANIISFPATATNPPGLINTSS